MDDAVPTGHAKHDATAVAPVVMPYRPAVQFVHTEAAAAEYRPMTQVGQVLEDVLTPYRPARHAVHVVAPIMIM